MGYDDGDLCDDCRVLDMLEWAFELLSSRGVFETYKPLRPKGNDHDNAKDV